VVDQNDFTKRTRDILAKRAGQLCSNPYCNKTTTGPHSKEDKAVDVGEAAHIRGAHPGKGSRPGSKRFDPTMTSAERSNITNGIWLCRTCAKLIDSDETKYTVEVLYEWKRTHEAKIERQLNSSGWQREIREKSIKAFENESAAAFQIAIDQPPYWEYLITVELLRHKLSDIKRDFRDLERGLAFRPIKAIIYKEEFYTWIQGKLHDLTALIELLPLAATEELQSAYGEPGEPGNALEILRATNKIAEGCNWLLDWEIDLHFTKFPDGFESIKLIMEGWTKDLQSEMSRIPSEIAKAFNESPNPEETITINLIFQPPKNLSELLPAMQRVSQELYFEQELG
jgi:hypothetical protein